MVGKTSYALLCLCLCFCGLQCMFGQNVENRLIDRSSKEATGGEQSDIESSYEFTLKQEQKDAPDEIENDSIAPLEKQPLNVVSDSNFNKGNIFNPLRLIQGKVSGLSIVTYGGNPNTQFDVRIRGIAAFGSNPNPLVVIDGIPGVALSSIDPADIESVEVLKDAAAASIYGIRGASGVLLITSKKGRSNNFRVNYRGYMSIDRASKFSDFSSADEYRLFINEEGFGTDLLDNTNWSESLAQTAFSQTHSLSLSGGTTSSRYRVSLNYRDNDGVAINTGFNQLSGRLKLDQTAFNGKLNMGLNLVALNRSENNILPETFAYASQSNPTQSILDGSTPQFGGYYERDVFDYYNAVSIANQSTIDNSVKHNIISGIAAYDITDSWSVSTVYSQQYLENFNGGYINTTQKYRSNGHGLAGTIQNNEKLEYFNLSTKLELGLGESGQIDLFGGYSYQYYNFYNQFLQGGGFITDEFSYNNLSSASDFTNGLGITETNRSSHRLAAFFGRASFSFEDTFFGSLNYRREGSSRLGSDNKWGNFYGMTAGVDVGKLFDSKAFEQFSLRVGYGKTGNLPTKSYESLLKFGPNGLNYFNSREFEAAIGPLNNSNPDLKWEEKTGLNVGMDMVSKNERIRASLGYYYSKTKDLISLFSVTVPPNIANHTLANTGELINSGLEFTMGVDAVNNGSFTWNSTIATTYYLDVKLNSLSDANSQFIFNDDESYRGLLGSPGPCCSEVVKIDENATLGQIYGLDFQRYSQDGTSIIFTDANGDGFLDELSDRTIIGNALPKLDFGWTNNLKIARHWNVSFTLRATTGHELVNANRALFEAPPMADNYNIVETTEENAKGYNGPLFFSSLHVENASFLKLDNFEISYKILPSEKSPFSDFAVFIAGNNIFTLTGYSGIDPEVRWSDVGIRSVNSLNLSNPLANIDHISEKDHLALGIDRRGTYFPARSFSIGIDITF